MRLSTKRALDYWIGRPILTVLGAAAKVLGAVLRRSHATDPVRTALFVKFEGIGSLVIAKPAIAAFRRHYPDARCIFWGTPGLALVAENMPEFDEIVVLDDRSVMRAARTCAAALLRVWRLRLDWAFDLEVYSRLSSVLVTATCARNRAGFALEQLRARRVHTHLIYFNRYGYIGEAYSRMIGQMVPRAQAVVASDYGDWRFGLAPLPAVPRPYFVLNVHAGSLSLERRWPLESFRMLIDELLHRVPGATVVLIGHTPGEVRYASGLARERGVVDLNGKLDLADTVRVLANADLIVTNDSGPMHLAFTTRAPVVALFGPTRGETYRPAGRAGVLAVQEPIYCSPCVHHWEPPPCRGDNQCMKRLSVARVLDACTTLLGLPAGPPRHDAPGHFSDYFAGVVYTRAVSPKATHDSLAQSERA